MVCGCEWRVLGRGIVLAPHVSERRAATTRGDLCRVVRRACESTGVALWPRESGRVASVSEKKKKQQR